MLMLDPIDEAIMRPFEIRRSYFPALPDGWLLDGDEKQQSTGPSLTANQREKRRAKRKAQRAARKRQRRG